MFWVVEYDNGYYFNEKNEEKLDICKKYFYSQENALKYYEFIKNRLSTITDPGFENVEWYGEFFSDDETYEEV